MLDKLFYSLFTSSSYTCLLSSLNVWSVNSTNWACLMCCSDVRSTFLPCFRPYNCHITNKMCVLQLSSNYLYSLSMFWKNSLVSYLHLKVSRIKYMLRHFDGDANYWWTIRIEIVLSVVLFNFIINLDTSLWSADANEHGREETACSGTEHVLQLLNRFSSVVCSHRTGAVVHGLQHWVDKHLRLKQLIARSTQIQYLLNRLSETERPQHVCRHKVAGLSQICCAVKASLCAYARALVV